MILLYSGKAKYMQGVKRVEVTKTVTIGKSFVVYCFLVNGTEYAVAKTLVDNGKTWKVEVL